MNESMSDSFARLRRGLGRRRRDGYARSPLPTPGSLARSVAPAVPALHVRPCRGRSVGGRVEQRRRQPRRPLRSGVGNLAFCLLANGGTHPRGKTTVVVPAIGLEKAIRILYKAQANYPDVDDDVRGRAHRDGAGGGSAGLRPGDPGRGRVRMGGGPCGNARLRAAAVTSSPAAADRRHAAEWRPRDRALRRNR